MSYPLLAIQQAVFAELNGDAALQNLINGLYDQPPDNAVYPFVAFDAISAEDWSFYGAEGVQVRLSLESYSRYHGKSETFSILARIHDLLHDASLNASGIAIVQTRLLQSSIEGLRDGRTTRGRMVFRLLAHAV